MIEKCTENSFIPILKQKMYIFSFLDLELQINAHATKNFIYFILFYFEITTSAQNNHKIMFEF